MNKLEQEETDKEVQVLKSQIGFGTAFKATLGFYAAKFVAGIVGLAIFGLIGLAVITTLYFIFR